MTITIPKNIDIKARIKDFETQNKVSRKFKEKVYYFLSRIFINNYNRERYRNNAYHVKICSSEMKKIIGNREYQLVRKLLIHSPDPIVEIVENYSTKKNCCKGYRLTAKLNDGEVDFKEISDKYISVKNTEIKNENSPNYDFMFEYFQQHKLTVDSGVYPHIKVVGELLLNKIEKGNKYQESVILDKVGYWLFLIDRFKKKEFYPSISKSNHRINSLFTDFPRILRKNVLCNAKPFVAIDIKSSQPFLLSVLLKREMTMFDTRRFNFNFNWNSFTEEEIINIKSFADLSFEEDFYVKLMELGNKNSFDLKQINREEIKKNVMFLLFDSGKKRRKNNRVIQLFKSIYPAVNRYIEEKFKLIGKKNFALELQKFESDLLIDKVCRKFNEVFPQVPLFSIHDCFYTTPEYVDDLSRIIRTEVFNETGKYPGMSFETSQIDSEFIEKELERTWENFEFEKSKTQMEDKNTLIFQCNINRAKSFLGGFDDSIEYSEAA